MRATLSHSSSDPKTNRATVHFDTSDSGCDPQALEEQIKRTVTLTEQVKKMDRKMGVSKDYIKFQIRQQKGTVGSMLNSTGDSDMMDYDYGETTWDGDDHDIMQDLDDD
jgi:hypothetical protein